MVCSLLLLWISSSSSYRSYIWRKLGAYLCDCLSLTRCIVVAARSEDAPLAFLIQEHGGSHFWQQAARHHVLLYDKSRLCTYFTIILQVWRRSSSSSSAYVSKSTLLRQ